MIFIRYDDCTKGYRCSEKVTRRIVFVRNLKFLEPRIVYVPHKHLKPCITCAKLMWSMINSTMLNHIDNALQLVKIFNSSSREHKCMHQIIIVPSTLSNVVKLHAFGVVIEMRYQQLRKLLIASSVIKSGRIDD